MGRRRGILGLARPSEPPFTYDVKCSDLEMVANSTGDAAANWTKLAAEAVKGTRVYVDGAYYIDNGTTPVALTVLNLVGDIPAVCELRLYGGNYFNQTGSTPAAKGAVLVSGVTITGLAANVFLTVTAPTVVNTIIFRGCHIAGNTRLVYSNPGLNYDYAGDSPFRVENFVFENNTGEDVYNIGGAPIIIGFSDTPVFNARLNNNKIKNFGYRFFVMGVNNDNGATAKAYLYLHNNVTAYNNHISCTDDYDVQSKGMDSGSYYCFVEFEGLKAHLYDNYFDGMHLFDDADADLYDNYLNATQVIFERNIIRNIVNFSDGLPYYDLIKAKTANTVAGYKKKRIYRDNTYVVEASYADRFGKSRVYLRKQLCNFTTQMDEVEITGNKFDLYTFALRYSGSKVTESYKFNDNIINADTCESLTDKQSFVYVFNNDDSEGNPIHTTLECKDNEFNAANTVPAECQGAGTSELLRVYQPGSDDLTDVTITGNTGNWWFSAFTDEATEIAKYTATGGKGTITISGNNVTPLAAA